MSDQYGRRPGTERMPATGPTRRIHEDEVEPRMSVEERMSLARERATRRLQLEGEFADLSRELHSSPTGVLRGMDVDVGFHYFLLAVGIFCALASLIGTVIVFYGGGPAFLQIVSERWAENPSRAVVTTLLSTQMLLALAVQAVLFLVMLGYRHNQRAPRYIVPLIISVTLTYMGWSSVLVPAATDLLAPVAAVVPAAIIGGVVTWGLVSAAFPKRLPKMAVVGMVAVGIAAGALDLATMLHWSLAMAALAADRVAQRTVVLG